VIDVVRARAETPGVANVAHLNNAGSALPPAAVHEAVVAHLELETAIGGYEAAARQADRIEHTYDAIAALIGCASDEVGVVENATRAWDMAFYAMRFGPGDRILTSQAEYASNYIALRQVADRTGAIVEWIPEDPAGGVDVGALEAMLDERVRLVSLVHVPSHGGLVEPAAAVGALTRAAGIPLILDACQSIGQMPVDVEAIGCDILSATGRKFLRGPRGTGFLYVRRALIERLEPPLLDLHAAEWLDDGSYRIRPDARRFENWECNYAAKIGLGVAVDYALGWGLDAIRDRVVALAAALRERLADTPGVTVHDVGREQGGIVTFSLAGTPSADIAAALRAERVNVSVSPRAYSRVDFARRGLDDMVRASVHYYNDDEELDRLVAVVRALRSCARQTTFS
jgi:cysteine desulfurase / selenocysteine lyase